jgi:hypothetical protein
MLKLIGSQTRVRIMNPDIKLIAILSVLIAVALIALAAPAVTCADAVTDWNAIASTTIVVNAGQPPPVSVLSFAMVQGAVYDAVNAIDRGHRPYLTQPSASPSDSKAAAAAAAAFRVLGALFPGQMSTLQATYNIYIAGLPDDPPGSKAAGIAVGEAAAAAMLAARQDDGRFGLAPELYPEAPACGGRRRQATRMTLPRGSGTCVRSLSLPQKCSAVTGRTPSPVLLMRRILTRLSYSVH